MRQPDKDLAGALVGDAELTRETGIIAQSLIFNHNHLDLTSYTSQEIAILIDNLHAVRRMKLHQKLRIDVKES